MACFDPSMFMQIGEHTRLIGRASRLKCVLCAIECHRGHGDLWAIYESGL